MPAVQVVNVNDIAETDGGTYRVTEILGSGSFGSVVKCLRLETNETVAIKFIRPNPRHPGYIEQEITMLSSLEQHTTVPDDYNLVRFFQCFAINDLTGLVFESLDQSLGDFLYKTSQKPFPFKYIRPVAFQLLTALQKLASLGIVHSDLKLQNIMLVNTALAPYKVKLIDFGCAFHVSQGREKHVQTIPFRSPEILLGLPSPYTPSIDVWSLGCVIAELALGACLYPGKCVYDMILYIAKLQGLLPAWLLSTASNVNKFFEQEFSWTGAPVWRLKNLGELSDEILCRTGETRKPIVLGLKSLADIIQLNVPYHLNEGDFLMEMEDRTVFIDLLQALLTLDSAQRVTAQDALFHPFLTLDHLVGFSNLKGYREASEAMMVCSYPFPY